ncbi:hypothetical protein Lfu02_14070 [Longispora fulva]|uniref:Uncharacterized protein n=1 Tax=Longispora fulva TaxID=619741 RepID=A0A8J7GH36_9ACTN|nr:hypothetical protein [Longispora fulva]MBG6140583.1 hypothetical protein [Longispora fulva]GIG57035.1 hypothetical protein Lfu02_14070 [Longispora fulva]
MGYGDNPSQYYGYSPGGNEELQRNRRLARHTGDDVDHYTPDSSGDEYAATPKIDHGHMRSDDYEGMSKIAGNSIEKIYKRVMAQDSGGVREAAWQWSDVEDLIDHLSTQIRTQTDTLRAGNGAEHPGWHSPGADAFLARGPGATLMSLNDWHDAARNNFLGMLSLAGKIDEFQGKMQTLFDRYKAAIVNDSKLFFANGMNSFEGSPQPPSDYTKVDVAACQRALTASNNWAVKDKYISFMRDTELRFTVMAQDLEYEMGQGYWQVMNNDLRGGTATVYEGPNNAVRTANMPGQKLMTLSVPSRPGGPPGSQFNHQPPSPTKAPVKPPPQVKPDLAHPPSVGDPTKLPDPNKLHDLDQLRDPSKVLDPSKLHDPGKLPGIGELPVQPPGLGLDQPSLSLAGGRQTPTVKSGLLGRTPSVSAPPEAPGLGRSLSQTSGGAPSVPPAMAKGGAKVSRPTGPQDAARQQANGPGMPPSSVLGKSGRTKPGQPAAPEGPEGRSPGATPKGTTPSVLGGRRSGARVGQDQTGTPGSTRPGTSPSVLGKNRDRDRQGSSGGPGAPLEDVFLRPVTEAGATAPVLRRSGAVGRLVADLGEVPEGLRASRPVVNSPAELAARKSAAQASREERDRQSRDDDYDAIQSMLSGETPWTVETPGGAVIANTPHPAPVPTHEPKPVLGGH